MSIDPGAPSAEVRAFLAERHLAILTTVDPEGRLHACAVGFTYDCDTGTARVITGRTSRKARNVAAGSRAVVAQVDVPTRWPRVSGGTPNGTGTRDPIRIVRSSRSRSPGSSAEPLRDPPDRA
jgi:F420H(2)-dependent biliverdin reductase